jgi:hypothetical protein
VRAHPVSRTSTSPVAKPWIGQNEMRRIGLCRASDRQRAQTKRGAGGVAAGLSCSTTKVISAYLGVNWPPPAPFQGPMAWPG